LLFPVTYKNLTSTTGRRAGSIRIDQKLLNGRQTAQAPIRILIPKLKMDLPVVEANVVNGYWELSETSASHGVGSASPGEPGNTVIFAHARDGLFGPLRDVARDDTVYVMTKDRWVRYRVTQTRLVDPNQTEVIAPTPDETLTLYTCSGFLDSKRFIVVAKPR
jgi:LPXTG-site transpeptidase (sortase) family protein